MKRIRLFFLLLLCLTAVTVPAFARSAADSLKTETTLTSDGNCTVSVNLTLTLDEGEKDPAFPIPAGAQNVTLNGGVAQLGRSGQSRTVSLKSVTGGAAGTFSVNIRYTLPGTVEAQEDSGDMVLTLPLLSGFSYPVEQFSFTVTLPGAFSARPTFVSDYYQAEAASLLELSYTDTTITGVTKEAFKDHESLTMTLPVDDTLFPQTAVEARVMNLMDAAVLGVVLLAVIYYLLAMRPIWPRRMRRASAPDGVCPGDCGQWLTGAGMDLTLLVVTWAQLGYLRIQLDDNGRVLLHKRMEMGNERNAFENRTFRSLFGRRRVIDGTGYHYAELCRSVARQKPQNRNVYDPHSGNPWIFRVLCALAGVLSGVAMAGAWVPHSTFLRILLAALGGAFALLIQSAGAKLPLRHRLGVYVGLICSGIWLVLGICAGETPVVLPMIVFQWLAGVGVAYGGRRTALGQQALEQLLGLRRHMRRVSKSELQQILKSNPGYFHTLAPYALALGVDRQFARRFGRLRLPECTYLMGGMNGQLSAAEWTERLRRAVAILDARAKRLPLEKLTGR